MKIQEIIDKLLKYKSDYGNVKVKEIKLVNDDSLVCGFDFLSILDNIKNCNNCNNLRDCRCPHSDDCKEYSLWRAKQ